MRRSSQTDLPTVGRPSIRPSIPATPTTGQRTKVGNFSRTFFFSATDEPTNTHGRRSHPRRRRYGGLPGHNFPSLCLAGPRRQFLLSVHPSRKSLCHCLEHRTSHWAHQLQQVIPPWESHWVCRSLPSLLSLDGLCVFRRGEENVPQGTWKSCITCSMTMISMLSFHWDTRRINEHE